MNKTKIILIIFVALAFIFGFYLFINYKKHAQNSKTARVKQYNDVFISKSLDMFNSSPSIKPSKIAHIVMQDINKTAKNPYNIEKPFYTFDKKCISCTSVDYDDDSRTIVITTYDEKGDLSQRTIIKPPSFVTYTK